MSVDFNYDENIEQIAERAVRLNSGLDIIKLMLDLAAANGANGNLSIDMAKLLACDDSNFAHDIGGISSNINRATGFLENHFVPRTAISAPEDSKETS